jgi:2-oxoglutarate ferredoxin oxidoreductase subunit gamma
MARYEFRLSGSGGQGLIFTGMLLGEAAAIYEGKNAVQTQSYGPEARGGASRSEVVLSDEDIDYPKVRHPDLLLCMAQEAYKKYHGSLKEEGILIIDPHFVKEVKPQKGPVYSIPLTQIAAEKTGKKITANVVALGAIAAITGHVSLNALQQAVRKRAPRGTETINLTALEEGYKAGEKAVEERKKGAGEGQP